MATGFDQQARGRLSTLQAAMVIARRDFLAILLSRSFLFFLLGPLFPLIVGGLAGGIGRQVKDTADRPVLGLALSASEVEALLAAEKLLAPKLGSAAPEIVVIKRLAPGESFDPKAEMRNNRANLAAIFSGSLAAPVLTGSRDRIERWQGPVSLLSAQALGRAPPAYPAITLAGTATSNADRNSGRILTAQAAQMMLFLLTMMLVGMVLSNLVEEKGNKIIEVLAAAIPMDAVFLGKLFAMLAVSLVGISVWALSGVAIGLAVGQAMPVLTPPAVGWTAFLLLAVTYFSMAYLLLGSVFLSIGSMATTVREVQTLSMPVSMMQLLVFFFASFAMSQPGSPLELAAAIFPFSSPFAMLARAALDGAMWPHLAALGWQALCVALFVKVGAAVFKRRVMKSGSAHGKRARTGLFARRKAA